MGSDIDSTVARVVRGEAPALYLLVDGDERVVESNAHTRALIGPRLERAVFRDLLVNFEQHLSAAELARAGQPRNLNVLTFSGMPQTYRCFFGAAEGRTVVLGAVDPLEQEMLRRELLALNQEASGRERELQKSQAELARLGRLKDEFLGMAAHDLRSPLTAIDHFSDFLLSDLQSALSTDHAEFLQGIRTSVELMKRLVDNFLDTAVIESGHLALDVVACQLPEVVRAALSLVEPVARRHGIRLTLVVPPGLPPVPADASKLQQVVINLVNNAIQHSVAGTEVRVELSASARRAVLAVVDQGAGMPAGLQKELFSAYVHGSRRSGERSIGLGLAITRMIVLAHGGTVDVTSTLGVGSTFTVSLPLGPPDP